MHSPLSPRPPSCLVESCSAGFPGAWGFSSIFSNLSDLPFTPASPLCPPPAQRIPPFIPAVMPSFSSSSLSPPAKSSSLLPSPPQTPGRRHHVKLAGLKPPGSPIPQRQRLYDEYETSQIPSYLCPPVTTEAADAARLPRRYHDPDSRHQDDRPHHRQHRHRFKDVDSGLGMMPSTRVQPSRATTGRGHQLPPLPPSPLTLLSSFVEDEEPEPELVPRMPSRPILRRLFAPNSSLASTLPPSEPSLVESPCDSVASVVPSNHTNDGNNDGINDGVKSGIEKDTDDDANDKTDNIKVNAATSSLRARTAAYQDMITLVCLFTSCRRSRDEETQNLVRRACVRMLQLVTQVPGSISLLF
ncbi:hypothetical protein BKA56DRAFT_676008 [Ilyonectria sp. MPI-CAGE-AT-0026]|nr:hypothetical protein BKA56DRAFT_676008 [Ilyonectria sp. MPI-CAGE-AT-0026]